MWRRRPASISIRSTASNFIRFCYAGSAADMHEAVERIGTWLRTLVKERAPLVKRRGSGARRRKKAPPV